KRTFGLGHGRKAVRGPSGNRGANRSIGTLRLQRNDFRADRVSLLRTAGKSEYNLPSGATMPAFVYVIATMDTKGREAAFVAERVRAAGVSTVSVDVGVKDSPVVPADVPRERVAGLHPRGTAAVLGHADRGRAVAAMSEALVEYLPQGHAAGNIA